MLPLRGQDAPHEGLALLDDEDVAHVAVVRQALLGDAGAAFLDVGKGVLQTAIEAVDGLTALGHQQGLGPARLERARDGFLQEPRHHPGGGKRPVHLHPARAASAERRRDGEVGSHLATVHPDVDLAVAFLGDVHLEGPVVGGAAPGQIEQGVGRKEQFPVPFLLDAFLQGRHIQCDAQGTGHVNGHQLAALPVEMQVQPCCLLSLSHREFLPIGGSGPSRRAGCSFYSIVTTI